MMDFGYTPGAVPRQKRHGNAGRPKPQTVAAARARAEDGSLPSDSRYLRSEVWKPLPGRLPIPMGALNAHTCRWPIGDPLVGFCGHHTEENPKGGQFPYCEFHHKIANPLHQQPIQKVSK